MKRILVCGGRDYADRQSVFSTLSGFLAQFGHLVVIQGGANGADKLAREWCCQREQRDRVTLINEPADWRKHGRAAGPIRNAAMLANHEPDWVIAFPGGRGTEDMCRQADAAGVPVHRFGVPAFAFAF